MGCDLTRQPTTNAAPSERIPMGSYSGVHDFRKMLVLLTAWHYLKKDEAQTAEEAIGIFPGDYPDDWARGLLALTKENPIDVSLFDNVNDYSIIGDTVRDERLEGLRKFVDHSDCDGRHSRGDVVDIAALLESVRADAEEVLNTEDHEWFERIARFFIAARDAHEFITYC